MKFVRFDWTNTSDFTFSYILCSTISQNRNYLFTLFSLSWFSYFSSQVLANVVEDRTLSKNMTIWMIQYLLWVNIYPKHVIIQLPCIFFFLDLFISCFNFVTTIATFKQGWETGKENTFFNLFCEVLWKRSCELVIFYFHIIIGFWTAVPNRRHPVAKTLSEVVECAWSLISIFGYY